MGVDGGVVMDGGIASGADNYCSSCQVTFITYGFNVTETVQYAGTSPGLIDGLMQINFTVPQPSNGNAGLWVYFTPPGFTYSIQLGWVNISQ